LGVLLLGSVASHIVARQLGLVTSPPAAQVFGSTAASRIIRVYGSSISLHGIQWDLVANSLDARVVMQTLPSASPAELEWLIRRDRGTDPVLVGISVHEMNENLYSDLRANAVPLGATVRDLVVSRCGWEASKRLLSLYPLAWVRTIFPTAGRSRAVLAGGRNALAAMAGRAGWADPDGALGLAPTGGRRDEESVGQWSPSRRLRNMQTLRAASRGGAVFGGPKALALERLLQRSDSRTKVTVVVFPVSPSYRAALNLDVQSEFLEKRFAELHRKFPQTEWLRLDGIDSLRDDGQFLDLYHLNRTGREIATEKLIRQLEGDPAL
jgi:hypothetical protein